MRYQHFDGTVCRLIDQTWQTMEGVPCPYCNRYPEAVTGRQKLSRWFLNQSSPGLAWFMIVVGILMLLLVLVITLSRDQEGIVPWALAAANVAFSALWIWAGMYALHWHIKRVGHNLDGT